MNTKQKYKLVWLPCSDKNKLAEKFYVPNYRTQLPFLINNEEQSKQFSISEKDLLLGVLVGIEDIESNNSYGINTDKDTLLYLLDVLGNGFQFKTPEKMILDLSYNLLLEKAKENACYYGFCALILSKAPKQTQDEFYNNFIIPNVKNRKLKKQIKVFIKNKESLNMSDLLII